MRKRLVPAPLQVERTIQFSRTEPGVSEETGSRIGEANLSLAIRVRQQASRRKVTDWLTLVGYPQVGASLTAEPLPL